MRGTNCAAHHHRSLVPIEVHHVWPTSYGGPNRGSNRVALCANAHGDVHYLLQHLLAQHDVNQAEYGPVVRALARRGYVAVMAYAASLVP